MSLSNTCRAAVVGLALLTFFPVMTFDFSGWDDRAVVARNPKLLHPTLDSLRAYWTAPEFDLYIPVTQSLWWLVAHVAGAEQTVAGPPSLRPEAFHAVNLILHAATALAVFELLRRLGVGTVAAAGGAGLFAVHPVQAEAVSWAAATKDLLAGGLSVAALTAYVASARGLMPARSAGNDRGPLDHRSGGMGRRAYIVATLLYVAAMLSKPSAVVLPLMAAAIDRFLLRRGWREVALPAGIWLLLAMPCVVWTSRIQPGLQEHYAGGLGRLLIAGDALAFYLGKLLWPARLAFDYGRTPHAVLASPAVYATALVPVAFAVALSALWRANRTFVVGATLFVLGVLPVLGLVPFDFQMYSTVGDHYLYPSMLGAALATAAVPVWDRRPAARAAAALAVIVALAVLAQRQAWTWRTMESMNRHTLAVNPGSWASHNNLAVALLESDRPDEAAAAAERAIALRPGDPYVRRTMASVRLRQADDAAAGGDAARAIDLYRRGLSIEPRNVALLTNLAATLAEVGRLDEAIALYQQAVEAAPHDSAAARAGIDRIRSMRTSPGASPSTAPATAPASGPATGPS